MKSRNVTPHPCKIDKERNQCKVFTNSCYKKVTKKDNFVH